MTKLAVVAALLLGACVDDDTTQPPVPSTTRDEADIQRTSIKVDAPEVDTSELCALAADLPPTDNCSLICDPDGFKARLIEEGMKTGTCYQLRCTLSPEVTVSVGVCLPSS